MPQRKKKVKVDTTHIVFAQVHGGIHLPSCLPQVRAIAAKGYTDKEISAIYGIPSDLFRAWRKAYPDFDDALNRGRLQPDAAVIEALFKTAVGYDFKEEGLTRTGAVREIRRHKPPDTTAIKYWLNNRAKEMWKDRSSAEVSGGSDEGAKPIGIKSEGRDEMIAAILQLVKPKPDDPGTPIKKTGERNGTTSTARD